MNRSPSPLSCLLLASSPAPPSNHHQSQHAEGADESAFAFCDTTPKAHNKRRSISCVSISGSRNSSRSHSNAHSSPSTFSFFNCESLQRSLKRVRLTTVVSSGELRLQRDLRHAVLHHRWIPVQKIDTEEEEWSVAYNDNRTLVTVSRISPMELALHIRTDNVVLLLLQKQQQLQQDCSSSSSTITLNLKFPLLYPHRPPTVRVNLPQHDRNTAATAVSAPWKMLIAASPDEAAAAYACFLSSGATDDAIANTFLWEEWTPIHRLADICDWLVETIIRHIALPSSTTTNTKHVRNPHLHLNHSSQTILADCRRTTHRPCEEKKDDADPPSRPFEQEEDDDWDNHHGYGCVVTRSDSSPP